MSIYGRIVSDSRLNKIMVNHQADRCEEHDDNTP
jgi:hypothetical protein